MHKEGIKYEYSRRYSREFQNKEERLTVDFIIELSSIVMDLDLFILNCGSDNV